MTEQHHFVRIENGLWLCRARCTCGWLSRRRWRPRSAEADQMEHQRRKREEK